MSECATEGRPREGARIARRGGAGDYPASPGRGISHSRQKSPHPLLPRIPAIRVLFATGAWGLPDTKCPDTK
ncbi:MAG: hypothetical protein AVDCRST_MAG18-409 [uncultured Thermomicrobiales bacterium]|uniref:Uncharacterized protein n=1 Tax=uncultured Thermomicrobiales bacterium TaxID=1645740 RepID=A0A6J4UKT2_9BACT|nr:MAG: hypothetical protein AVDCRST_MAG18-409 [uncultured Thermomicrobiales bacterium]